MTESSITALRQGLVWSAADEVLRNAVPEEEYGDYILPFAVLRRLECLLEPHKAGILEFLDTHPKLAPFLRDSQIQSKFGVPFYNTSPFTLGIIARTDDRVLESLELYLDGWSESVADIWESFDLRGKLATLDKAGRLYAMVRKFAALDLSVDKVDEMVMGDIFEDLMYRAFSTKGKGAGAFYTPRDAIRLMVDVLFASDDLGLRHRHAARSIYDPTAGTAGMLLVAYRHLTGMNADIDLSLHGQEMMPWAHAVGKADLLIQTDADPNDFRLGNTLTNDLYAGDTFDYVLSNPPFGSDWKSDYDAVAAEAAVPGSRFSHGLPSKDDGQMLFLAHVVSKLTPADPTGTGGGRGAVVSNGSPLFTGRPGSGPDRIRRWLLESDLVDAIIGLPTDMFYGTGIATYVWIVDTNKPAQRRGKVQLIDATGLWSPMRKGLGFKRRYLDDAARKRVLAEYDAFVDSDISRVLSPADLGFLDVPVRFPRRLGIVVDDDAIAALAARADWQPAHEGIVRDIPGGTLWNDLPAYLRSAAKKAGTKMPLGLLDAIMQAVAVDDPAEPPAVDRKGAAVTDGRRLTERIPLDRDVDEHMHAEVVPFAPDAVWDAEEGVVGYEIPFTRIFYTPEPVRSLEEIDADVLETMNSLAEQFKAVRE